MTKGRHIKIHLQSALKSIKHDDLSQAESDIFEIADILHLKLNTKVMTRSEYRHFVEGR